MPVCCVCGAEATGRRGNIWLCSDERCDRLAVAHGPRTNLGTCPECGDSVESYPCTKGTHTRPRTIEDDETEAA